MPEGHALRAVQDTLNAGNIDEAVQMYFAAPISTEQRMSPEGRRLRDAMQAASDTRAGQDTGADASERVTAQWLPQLSAMETSPPTTAAGLWGRLSAYEEFARTLEENPVSTLTPGQVQVRNEFRSALSARQASDLPVLRKAYREIVGVAVFRQQTTVAVSGTGGKTITWTSPLFASNAAVEDSFTGSKGNLLKLRFAKSQYRWANGLDDGADYDVRSPNDGSVGYWSGQKFVEVD